jgi:hypothetical protein
MDLSDVVDEEAELRVILSRLEDSLIFFQVCSLMYVFSFRCLGCNRKDEICFLNGGEICHLRY